MSKRVASTSVGTACEKGRLMPGWASVVRTGPPEKGGREAEENAGVGEHDAGGEEEVPGRPCR